jgi:hypothetical protein
MKHLKRILSEASHQNYIDGMAWYNDANQFCIDQGIKYQVSTELVASVVAALSPRNNWAKNKIDAENVVSHKFKGTELNRVSTYGKMLKKALILCDEKLSHNDRIKILNGPKIQSFYCNIIGDSSKVTIDSWIDQAASGKYKSVKKRKPLTIKRYRSIELAIQKLAIEKNIKPYQAQAIIWVSFQEKIKNA